MKNIYKEPEIIERDILAKVWYERALITLEEKNRLINRNQSKQTPEQEAEFDRVIGRNALSSLLEYENYLK
jgi:hypothetical protein